MDVSLAHFLQQVLSNPALTVTTLLTLGVIFVNGWTDAPNAIATCVTTRCMRVRSAVIMAAIFNFLGVFIMTQLNASVASTISNMVDFGGNTADALTALCAALMIFDGAMTLVALDCWYSRLAGAAPDNALEQFCAEQFDNQWMENRFESMSIHPDAAHRSS